MTDGADNLLSIHARLRKREKRVRSSSEGIYDLFERLGGREQTRLIALWKNWAEVMGEPVASLSYPLGHKEETLSIGADDTMAMQELSLLSEDILERANAFMGRDCFTRVSVLLRQGRPDLARKRPVRDAAPAPVQLSWPRLGRLMGRLDPDSPVTRCYEAHVAHALKK